MKPTTIDVQATRLHEGEPLPIAALPGLFRLCVIGGRALVRRPRIGLTLMQPVDSGPALQLARIGNGKTGMLTPAQQRLRPLGKKTYTVRKTRETRIGK